MARNVITAVVGTALLVWLATTVLPVLVGLMWLVSLIFTGA